MPVDLRRKKTRALRRALTTKEVWPRALLLDCNGSVDPALGAFTHVWDVSVVLVVNATALHQEQAHPDPRVQLPPAPLRRCRPGINALCASVVAWL